MTQKINQPLMSKPNARAFQAPASVIALVSAITLVFLFQNFGPKELTQKAFFFGSLIPARFDYAFQQAFPLDQLLLPLVSFQFLHGSWTHLILNMMFLLAFGSPVAWRLSTPSPVDRMRNSGLGTILFLIFFLTAGIFSGLVYVFMHLKDIVQVVGASAGVSALMGAALRIGHFWRGPTGDIIVDKPAPLTHPMIIRFSIALVGINIAIGIFGNIFFPGGANIAWDAHISGYIFGLLASPWFLKLAINASAKEQ